MKVRRSRTHHSGSSNRPASSMAVSRQRQQQRPRRHEQAQKRDMASTGRKLIRYINDPYIAVEKRSQQLKEKQRRKRMRGPIHADDNANNYSSMMYGNSGSSSSSRRSPGRRGKKSRANSASANAGEGPPGFRGGGEKGLDLQAMSRVDMSSTLRRLPNLPKAYVKLMEERRNPKIDQRRATPEPATQDWLLGETWTEDKLSKVKQAQRERRRSYYGPRGTPAPFMRPTTASLQKDRTMQQQRQQQQQRRRGYSAGYSRGRENAGDSDSSDDEHLDEWHEVHPDDDEMNNGAEHRKGKVIRKSASARALLAPHHALRNKNRPEITAKNVMQALRKKYRTSEHFSAQLRAWDKDHDGQVSRQEMRTMLDQMGLPLNDVELDCFVEYFDMDQNDGSSGNRNRGNNNSNNENVSLEKFVTTITASPMVNTAANRVRAEDYDRFEHRNKRIRRRVKGLAENGKVMARIFSRVREQCLRKFGYLSLAFRAMDANKDGVLTYAECRDGFRRLNLGMTKPEIDAVICAIDADENGVVEFDELTRAIEQQGSIHLENENTPANNTTEVNETMRSKSAASRVQNPRTNRDSVFSNSSKLDRKQEIHSRSIQLDARLKSVKAFIDERVAASKRARQMTRGQAKTIIFPEENDERHHPAHKRFDRSEEAARDVYLAPKRAKQQIHEARMATLREQQQRLEQYSRNQVDQWVQRAAFLPGKRDVKKAWLSRIRSRDYYKRALKFGSDAYDRTMEENGVD
eukprot:TRINITY_DN66026_c3_g2_i1.p1 TRINITY_DN66026_c3_g2~~TRINITY_DN66026_c3_g2_i1.p1  ORF type:complete len:747 (+),score=393.87 TRINITY_DN66026_c3_g2_i1:91-2331(+)